jgi:thiamine-monophosphate kinase
MKTLADIGEDALVRRITAKLKTDASVLLGPGDDCAVVNGPGRGEKLVLKTDTIVEGVHFTPDTPPKLIGRKAMARVLSDFAAMAAIPRHALVTLIAPPSTPVKRVLDLYAGMSQLADEFDVRIVGGETSSGSQLVITVSMSGTVPKKKCVTRSGARAGDHIFVTGTLGGSIKGKHLKFQPLVREAQTIARLIKPTAMMDLSDGLAKDLPRLADQCGLGYELELDSLPCTPGCNEEQALNDGEDYELLLTISPRTLSRDVFSCGLLHPGLKLRNIGTLLADPKQRSLKVGGWDHFKK